MGKDRFLIYYLVDSEFYPWICHSLKPTWSTSYLIRETLFSSSILPILPLVTNSLVCSNFKSHRAQALQAQFFLTPQFSLGGCTQREPSSGFILSLITRFYHHHWYNSLSSQLWYKLHEDGGSSLI